MANKKLKVGNVPNLRFPGFEGEWETKKLGEINVINPKNENLPFSFIYIDLESVINGRLLKEERILKDEAPSRAQRRLAKGDILFQMVRPYQKNNLYFDKEGDYVASTGYAQIRTLQNSQFIFQYLHNQKFVDKVIERCTGTSYPAINSSDLGNIKIHYPNSQEQSKISKFLELLDSRIQTQNKIIRELNALKANVTKRIFSRKLKFKDDSGKNFPEWEYKVLAEIGKFSGGGTPSSSNPDFWNGDIPWVSSSDLSENNIHSINITRFINGSAINNSSTKLCPAPLILIVSRVGVGKVAYSKESLCTSQDFLNIYNFSCDGIFLTYLLSIEMKKAASNTQGTSIKGISSAEIKSKLIFLPCIAEQTKIADFLSSIDSKIDMENQLLQKLEEQKKFLLHQIFV